MKSPSCYLTVVGVLLVTMVGCGPWAGGPGRVEVWAVPDSTVLFPDVAAELENAVFSRTAGLIRLDAAVGETVSFQIAVRSAGGPATVWGVQVHDFAQGERTISGECFRLYREVRIAVEDYPTWYLRLTPHLRQRREYPDVLIPFSAPRGALPIELTPDECEAVWVDFTVPVGTEPGLYRSTLEVMLEPDNLMFQPGRREPFEVVLTVYPFSLPQAHHLPVVAGLDADKLLKAHLEVDGRPYAPPRLAVDDPAYPAAVHIIDAGIGLLHDHRCSAMLTDLQPVRTLNVRGELDLDWTEYDRLVGRILDGSGFEDRVPVGAWPLPIDSREPDPQMNGGWGSAGYERMLLQYIPPLMAHFAERGWLDRHFVWIQPPADSRAEQYRQFEWLGRVLKRADPRLATVCTLTPQSMAPFGWRGDPWRDLSSWVSIWAPPASLADPSALAAQRTAGKRTWLYPDRPPYCGSLAVFAPPDHPRSLGWQARRFGYDAILLPKVNNWPNAEASAVPAAPATESLIWPGKAYGLDRPVPSIRLKRLMRGLQDYEYLWLLSRNRRPAVADLIAADLFAFGGAACYGDHFLDGRPNGWLSDPAAWSLARALLAREIMVAIETGEKLQTGEDVAAAAEGSLTSLQQFEQQLDWRRHAEAVRRVRTVVEGVRARLNPSQPKQPLVLDAQVSIFNATRKLFSGQLAWAAMPTEWDPLGRSLPVEELAPGRAVLRNVEVCAPSVATNLDGVLPMQLEWRNASIEVGMRPASEAAQEMMGRVCLLTASRLTRPIVMDGRLDEWPLGTNNVAGDFVLVGAQDVPKQGGVSPDRPSQPTLVFAGRDDRFLYFAFNCRDDHMQERRLTRSNDVAYDELWPTIEDLVEVVIDPTGQALTPGDLLHIVVKANGAVVTERGAPCLAAIGGHGDWPAGVVAAIDDQAEPGRWMVEIRVPLEMLKERAPIFGVNFARYQPRLGEYSTWSGARRYLYAPASLGNMQLAP